MLRLKKYIHDNFNAEDWHDLGLLTGCSNVVSDDSRLLRSLSFGDDDYGERVAVVLQKIVKANDSNLDAIEQFVALRGAEEGEQAVEADVLLIRPKVFKRPTQSQQSDLVAIMMPFSGFDQVYVAIKRACATSAMRCERSDDIWNDAVILQDIFELIYRSTVVICDLTNQNPNVYYEVGIAHALGRDVIPIAQSLHDVPSDFRHHRVLKYMPNAQGLQQLSDSLAEKLSQFRQK